MIGTTIGSYRIVEKIGEGAMGAVYRAVDVMLDRAVAVKALRPELSRQSELAERFRAEAVALARLNHPNIAILHGLLSHEGQLFMVMEFVRGETLEQVIRDAGPMNWRQAAQLSASVLDALQHAHERGVVHRDVKPSNLMLSRRGVVKVMDFGVARLVDQHRQTRTGVAVGTRMYMSPEQIHGHDVDGRTDVYAMGAVLFELVTGRMPFEATSEYDLLMAQLNEPPPLVSELVPGVPPAIDAIVARAMEKRREDRYGSAMDFRRALLAALAEAPPVPEEPVGASEPAPQSGLVDSEMPQEDSDAVRPTRLVDIAPETGSPAAPTRLVDAGPGGDAPATPTPAAPTRVATPPPAAPTRVAAGPQEEPGRSAPSRARAWVRDRRAYAVAAVLLLGVGLAALALRPRQAPPVHTNAGASARVATQTARTAPAKAPMKPLATPVRSSPIVQPARSSGPPGFKLPPIAEGSTSAATPEPSRRGPPAASHSGAPAPARPPAATPSQPVEAHEQPSPSNRDSAVRPEPRAESSTLSASQVGSALAVFTTAVRSQDSATVRRLYATAGAGDAGELKRVLDLMRNSDLRIDVAAPAGPVLAPTGLAQLQLEATAQWRTPFGGNRHRKLELAVDLKRAASGWLLTQVRIVGAGLK